MKREGKYTKKKDGVVNNYASTKSKKVMSSNLPLLFANGRPRSLETISQLELEEFVPFMILCSLGQELHKKPKEINNCPVPEWWPQGFPFKFPLVEQSDWINKQVMLKSLVCRCYTFYDCEFLLKFSSELAEMSPSHLKFEGNKNENTTTIYDASGCMLVKCRNENLNYDKHKNRRTYLSPAHRPTLSQSKKFEPVIDLTFDTSSEDEKEVYFKEAPAASRNKALKRKIEVCEEPPAKKRSARRIFHDFPKEEPEPTDYSQEKFMGKFDLIPMGKQIVNTVYKSGRKKRLAHSFTILSVSSKRGQELLVRNKHSFNLEASLDRIDRYCSPHDPLEDENNQVCTRASLMFSAMFKDEPNLNQAENEKETTETTDDQFKWCHTYKWPHRTKNPRFPHKGPALKDCSVTLAVLSEETINFWTNRRRTVGTMTPDGWWRNKMPICACQKIPLIILEDDDCTYKHKSSSTRCTCVRPKLQLTASTQIKKASLEVKPSTVSNPEHSESPVKVRPRHLTESLPRGGGGFNISGTGSTRPVTHSFSYDKEGISVMSYNALPHSETSHNYKRALHRRPLAVVSPTPIVVDKVEPDILCESVTFLPQHTFPISFLKVNFKRSILDAIKWYTKDDPVTDQLEILNGEIAVKEEIIEGLERSQENIKPFTELILPGSMKPIDYFQMNVSSTDRDYCFERSSDNTSKLVTRRGERHIVNREPCPACFQGRDNFCVYEFIRQAKLAGVTLLKNQKHLQLLFFKLIQAVHAKA